MPFYKVGEQAAPIAPSTHTGRTMATREEIDAWFENTILALQDDPYIHMESNHEDYSELFRVLNDESNRADSIYAGSMSIEEYEIMQKELLFEKSLAGQLFYYDPTLGENGGFRQLYTKQVTVDGKQDYELCITGDVNEFPKTAPTKPQHPGMWKYLFYPFFAGQFKEYKAQMKEYEARMGEFEKISAMENSLAQERPGLAEYVEERTYGQFGNTFQNARDIQAEKREAYETVEQQEQELEQDIAANESESVNVKGPDPITPGLKPYNQEKIDACMQSIAYKDNAIPRNMLEIDGDKYGTLVAMALGSPELFIKIDDAGHREYNNPDVYYQKILDHHLTNTPLSPSDKSAGFLEMAWGTVLQGMRDAPNGDFSKLGKIIAQGLTQNNKVLQEQRELTDRYSVYATLGVKVLDLIKSNKKLERAVMDHLGPDTKQIEMANAAKNISALRKEAMPLYENMLQQIDKVAPLKSDVAKVLQLFSIEVSMNKNEFDLANNEYAKTGAAEKLSEELDKSRALDAFLKDENRVEILKDPKQMKELYDRAVEERKQYLEYMAKQQELDKVKENQLEEPKVDISMV